jgi:hypothetical protein
VSEELAALLFITIDELVDALVRGRRLASGLEISADLLRGPILY